MNKNRPVNLRLTSIHFPITAIVSVLHRVSGLLLFLFIPYVLWLLWYSLYSPHTFAVLEHYMNFFILRLVVWAFISALFFHLVAGIKHLILDLGLGESLQAARLASWFVFFFTWAVIIFLAIYILGNFEHVLW